MSLLLLNCGDLPPVGCCIFPDVDRTLPSQTALLQVERVEVSNTAAGAVELRVHGNWPNRQPVMLVVTLHSGGEQLLSPNDVTVNPGGNHGVVRFTIARELRSQIHDALGLQVGEERIMLPVSLGEKTVLPDAAVIDHPSMGNELKQLREERSGLQGRVEELEQARRSAELRNDAEWRRRIELERTVDQLRDERNDFELRFGDAQAALLEERQRFDTIQAKLLEEEARCGALERELSETKRSAAAEIERLERALQQRSERYEQLHEELQNLQSEAATLRAQALHESHDPSTLETLVAEVTGTATKLRERVSELEAQRLEAELGLTAAQTQLENEQRIRTEHEDSLRADLDNRHTGLEQRIVALDQSLQQRFLDERKAIEGRLGGIEKTLQVLQGQLVQPQRRAVVNQGKQLQGVIDKVASQHVVGGVEDTKTSEALVDDLAAAQERLKAQAEQQQREDVEKVPVSVSENALTSQEVQIVPQPQAKLQSSQDEGRKAHELPTSFPFVESGLAKPGDVADMAKLRARVVPASARHHTPWLRDALIRLSAKDQVTAERLFVGFLEAQLPRSRRPFRYGAVVDGGGAYCVSFAANRSHVHSCEASEMMSATKLGSQLDYLLAGPLASLIWLATGGAPRRLGGVKNLAVQGRRRQAKRLLRTRHQVLNLAAVPADSARLDPADLLKLFATAIPIDWLRDQSFVMKFKVLGEQAKVVVLTVNQQQITVETQSGIDLSETAQQEPTTLPSITVSATAAGLRALLFRVAPPMSETPTVFGPREYAERWLEWVDRLQGIARLP